MKRIQQTPIEREIAHHAAVLDQANVVPAANRLLLAALSAAADRINVASGSPSFTSDEHEYLLGIIYATRGEARS
jgi:hypothetical protein